MRPFQHILVLILFMISVLVWPGSSAHASSQNELIPNPAAEAYLLSELRAVGGVDFEQGGFPVEGRVISADTLLRALQDSQVQSNPFIYIANATVVGDLFALKLHAPATLMLEKMDFEGQANFMNAQLESLFVTGSTFKGYVGFSGAATGNIDIGDSTFQDSVDFSGAAISGHVTTLNSTFQGNVDFSSAAISGVTNITENAFHKNLIFMRTVFSQNVSLPNNVIDGGLEFYGARISGDLILEKSKILGNEPISGDDTVNFWFTTVEGPAWLDQVQFGGQAYFGESNFESLDMSESTFSSDANFYGTTVETFAYFNKTEFSGKASFERFYVGNTAEFKSATFQADTTFENTIAIREADFEDATFNGKAEFRYFTAERFMDFVNTTFNKDFSFYYTTVAWPYFVNVSFNGPVTFEGMHTSEDFELTDTSYNYADQPFKAMLMEVGGTVKFDNFTAPAGIDLSNGHFGNLSISTKNNPAIAFINITATDIDGQLTIQKVNMQRFLGEGATIDKSTTLDQVSITKELNMGNADIGFLKLDAQPRWPTSPEDFNLLGMKYTDINLGGNGLSEATFQSLLNLIDRSAYTPQAYEELAQFLSEKGHPDWAAQVEFRQKSRERDKVLKRFSGSWLWSWFLYIFAGYGKRPIFALGWSGLVIAIGALVFRRKENMIPVEQSDTKVEYNPIWYSFALFLPYIDLGIASKWEPDPCRKWLRNYKYVHMMLGWILAPIALLTFSGVIG